MAMRPARAYRAAALLGVAVLPYMAGASHFAMAQAVAQRASPDPYVTELAAAVNNYRAARALRPLQLEDALSRIAHGHAEAMARAGKLGHDGFPERVRAAGLPMCVENVGWNYPTAQAQFDAWRASPGHDQNMTRAGVQTMGIGVARGYVTLIACGP